MEGKSRSRMVAIKEYPWLTAEEARLRFIHLAHRIYSEQFHNNFFVKDPRPERYLQYELVAFWEGRIKEFKAWIGPVDAIAERYYSKLAADQRRTAVHQVAAAVTSIVQRVNLGSWNVIGWIKRAINKIINIGKVLGDIWTFISTNIYSYLYRIYLLIEPIAVTIFRQCYNAVSYVYHWLIRLWYEWIKPGVTQIIFNFKWLWEKTLEFVQKAVVWSRNIYNKLLTVWEHLTEQVSGSFETLSKQVAALPQAIAVAFQAAISYLRDVFERIWNEILVPFGKELSDGLVWIAKQLETAFFAVINSLEDIFKRIAPVTPEAAPSVSFSALKVCGLAAGGLLAMTAAWDLVHPFKDVIPGELKAMLYDVTNYKMILGALTGALTAVAIAQPMKYYYNSIFRPYVLSWRDLMELLSRAKIEDEDFKRFMHYYGYDDIYFKYFKELANTPVRYFGLAAVARTGYYDETFFKEELDRSGYSDRAKRIMLQMYQQTANEALRGYYGSVVIKRYREGIIDKNGLDHELKMLGYPKRQREQLITGAELYYDLDTVTDYIDAICYSYRRGKITVEELEAELARLGIRDDNIRRIVLLELARAKEEVGTTQEEEVRAYGRSTAIKRFREGLTTERDLEQELRALGYSEQWIERLKLAARLERDYDFAQTVLRYAKIALRKKKITDIRFIELLRTFGFTDNKILLELDLIKLAYGLGLEEEEMGG